MNGCGIKVGARWNFDTHPPQLVGWETRAPCGRPTTHHYRMVTVVGGLIETCAEHALLFHGWAGTIELLTR